MSTAEEPCTCRDILDVEKMVPRQSPEKWNASGLRAEIRAVEQGHRALLVSGVQQGRKRSAHAVREKLHDLSWDRIDYSVVSNCRHQLRHTVKAFLDDGLYRAARFQCSCEAGTHRVWAPIPCKHAALVARRLEREGLLVWDRGLWWRPEALEQKREHDAATAHLNEHPDDPFEGLALE